jgi:hypothetical protein
MTVSQGKTKKNERPLYSERGTHRFSFNSGIFLYTCPVVNGSEGGVAFYKVSLSVMRTLIRKTWKFKQYSIFFTTETKD